MFYKPLNTNSGVRPEQILQKLIPTFEVKEAPTAWAARGIWEVASPWEGDKGAQFLI